MKTITTILILIVSVQVFGQNEAENELKRIFYSLPIRSEIENIIDSAKNVDLISTFDNRFHNSGKPYLTGYINKNDFITVEPASGQIEIFRSGQYTLWGAELDSLDIIYISLDYGDQMSKELRKEYKRLIKTFKKITETSEKYKLYADPGLIGYGYCFFKSENDRLPFMSIEIGLGDCVSNSKSLSISYYKIDNYEIQLD